MEYKIVYQDDIIRYKLYESKYDWILSRVWEENIEMFEGEQAKECSFQWNAKESFIMQSHIW